MLNRHSGISYSFIFSEVYMFILVSPWNFNHECFWIWLKLIPISMCLQDLVQGFDQEAAAVIMARLASYKMEMEVIL